MRLEFPSVRRSATRNSRGDPSRVGAISVEYAVLLGLILAIAFAAIVLFGQEVLRIWTSNSDILIPALGYTGMPRRLPEGLPGILACH